MILPWDLGGPDRRKFSEKQKSTLNLMPIRTEGGCKRRPLFWIHGDSSDAFLKDYLDPDQPLYAFKHQGRHGERVLHTHVETIAAHYLAQIFTVQTEGPYFLGGYSFGGTVAFEMARQLQTKNQTVGLLFIINSLCPGTHAQHPWAPPGSETRVGVLP